MEKVGGKELVGRGERKVGSGGGAQGTKCLVHYNNRYTSSCLPKNFQNSRKMIYLILCQVTASFSFFFQFLSNICSSLIFVVNCQGM